VASATISLAFRFSCWIILSTLLQTPSLYGQTLRDDRFLDAARQGFHQIYNLDYSEALRLFGKLQGDYPEHPGPPLYLASVTWLRELFEREELDLNKFVAPGYFTEKTTKSMPTVERDRFFKFINRSQQLSQQILDKKPDNLEAKYFEGAALGILGSFAFTIDRDLKKAFSHGKKAYQIHSQIIKSAPEFYDAYMSVGLYEYVVGNLPWYIKWLAAIIGYRGSKERGFEYLSLAAENAAFVAEDSRVLKMVLLIREERYSDALKIASELHHRYPKNFIVHVNIAQIYDLMGEKDVAAKTYGEVVELAENGHANYQKLSLQRFRFQVARKLKQFNHLAASIELFEKVTTNAKNDSKEVAWAHLYIGQILDLKKERQKALFHYQTVLGLPDTQKSHSTAKRYLKRPYSRD
jgi:tetratricopeptide (TPR) repeat protein